MNSKIKVLSKKQIKKPDIHEDLEGFDIKINRFGQLQTNFEIDKLNVFLNENVEDKKLKVNSEEE